MTTDPTFTPVVARLQNVVAKGHEFISRTNLSRDVSGIWIMQVRAALTGLYGRDTPEVEFWCPKWTRDTADVGPAARINARLPALERLLNLLAVSGMNNRIFIGHGRSSEWLKLRIFLSQDLNLVCDEFNIEPIAGLQTGARIETMLNSTQIES